MIPGRPMLRIPVIAVLFLVLGLGTSGARAADWMINEDYKQLDPRGASDFDILLQGDVAGQITGGGGSGVTNPFANPSASTSKDAFGKTVVRFVGSNTIPADPNTNRHFGIYGTGPKPRILVKAWSFTTDPKRVRVPKSNFGYLYNAGSKTLSITIENTSPDTVTFSEVGYLISATEHPISDLTRRKLPPQAFEPLPGLNGEYPPGASLSAEIPGVAASAFALTYATVAFSGPSKDNAYTATGGEWAQVAVARQTVTVVQPAPPVDQSSLPTGAPAWALLPALAGLAFVVLPRVRRRPGKSRLSLVLLAGLSAGLLAASELAANVYVLELVPSPTGRPTILVNGIPMVIDTGATSPMFVTPATAGTLGLNTAAGTPGRSTGVGGSTPTTTGVPVPAGSIAPTGASTPTTPGGQGATTPPMPSTATVGQTASQGLLGSGWLNNFYYGRVGNFFWLVEKDQGAEGVATAIAMATFLGAPKNMALGSAVSRPPGTVGEAVAPSPPKVLPPGTEAADSGWVLGVDVSDPVSGNAKANQPFILKTGLQMTLITDTLARNLGLNLATLPVVTTNGNFGPIKVRQATLKLQLFADPAFPAFTIAVGVTDSRTNPFGEIFLGQDILGKLSSWEVSSVEGDGVTRFFAAP